MRSPVSTLPSVLFFQCFPLFHLCVRSSYGGVVVITTAQLHSTKTELRFCAGSNPAHGVSEICDGEDLWQWSRLEIRLHLSSVNHTTKTIHHHHHHHHHHHLYYIEWKIHWCQKFSLPSSTMSLLFENYWLVKVIYLLIRFNKLKFFPWNKKEYS